MRINKIISKGKMLQSLVKFSPLIVQEIYVDTRMENFYIHTGNWSLKGYITNIFSNNIFSL